MTDDNNKLNGTKPNNVVPIVPDKRLLSLTDNELMLGYQAASALMSSHIPAALSYDESGVVYEGQHNVIGRYLAIVWLDIKGRPVVTKAMSELHTEFTLERVQALASGIHQQFISIVQQQPKAPAAANEPVKPE